MELTSSSDRSIACPIRITIHMRYSSDHVNWFKGRDHNKLFTDKEGLVFFKDKVLLPGLAKVLDSETSASDNSSIRIIRHGIVVSWFKVIGIFNKTEVGKKYGFGVGGGSPSEEGLNWAAVDSVIEDGRSMISTVALRLGSGFGGEGVGIGLGAGLVLGSPRYSEKCESNNSKASKTKHIRQATTNLRINVILYK